MITIAWYTADFETNNHIDDCRVWAWGTYSSDENFEYGNDIESFIWHLIKYNGNTFYFHNLKFDGEFIISWLLHNGYTHITDKNDIASKTFETLITDTGVFYCMTIYFDVRGKNRTKVTIIDSMKVLPMSVAAIAKSFGMEESKLAINYNARREKNHCLTDEEISYLKNDVVIVYKALKYFFDMDLDRMTLASNAMKNYKIIVGKYFYKWFPFLDYDKNLRQAYRGGYTYLNPKYKNKVIGKGIVLDVNSLYPYVLREKKLPYGLGQYFEGEYEPSMYHDLYIQLLSCEFKVKRGYIPTVQLKGNNKFLVNEYVTDSKGQQTICLTNVDLELFFSHYEVWNIEFIGGWAFRSGVGMFSDFVDTWNANKQKASQEGNKGLRLLSKLMLNSLYGKFALNPKVQSKIPYLNNEGVVNYKLGEVEERKSIYVPVAIFTTAWARYITISTAQKNYKRFVYADTDSLHLVGDELPENIDIDDYKIGAWKLETNFIKAKYIRQKTYIEQIDNDTFNVVCAGMPHKLHDQIHSFNEFYEGKSYGGKLTPKRVKGGVVLLESDFTIKIDK